MRTRTFIMFALLVATGLVVASIIMVGVNMVKPAPEVERPEVPALMNAVVAHYNLYQPNPAYAEHNEAVKCVALDLRESSLTSDTLQDYVSYMDELQGLSLDDPAVDPIFDEWIASTGTSEYDKLFGMVLPWDAAMPDSKPTKCTDELIQLMNDATGKPDPSDA